MAAKNKRTTLKVGEPLQYSQDRVYTEFVIFASLLTVAIFVVIFSGYLYVENLITQIQYEAYASAAFSFIFPLLVFTYLVRKKGGVRNVIKSLGLSREKLTLKNIAFGIMLFFAILAVEIGMGAFESITNISLPTNVVAIYTGFPIWFFIFTFTIAPFNEEILFRGFLVPRIGIVFSALVFAVLHLSYLSIAELIGAFLYGIFAGYVFKRSGSLYSTVLAHALINMLAIVTLFLL